MIKLHQLRILKHSLNKRALREPRTPEQVRVRTMWERVRKILVKRY